MFAQLRDGSGEIQLYMRRDDLGQEAFDDFLKLYDLGDFVEVEERSFALAQARSRCTSLALPS